MSGQVNKERVNDTAKLMMHRLIARKIGRDPSLVEKARVSLGRSAEHFKGYSFIREWNDVLDLPVPRVRRLLTSRDEAMTRLRLSSPFVVTDGIDFEDEALRRRIWRAAKRITVRSTTYKRADGLDMSPGREICGSVQGLLCFNPQDRDRVPVSRRSDLRQRKRE